MKTIHTGNPTIDKLLTRTRAFHPDLARETEFWELYDICSKYSMGHVPGFFNLYSSLKYVHAAGIEGDFVECGVLLGGMSLFAALMSARQGAPRRVHLYDTFEGFPEDQSDVMMGRPTPGMRMVNFRRDVEENLASEGVTDVRLVEGPVEETLHSEPLPERIAILRLDTDFYASTRAELEQLYPRLVPGGVLIVDDYGTYEGSRRACDEYLGDSVLWQRIDVSVRSAVKPPPGPAAARPRRWFQKKARSSAI